MFAPKKFRRANLFPLNTLRWFIIGAALVMALFPTYWLAVTSIKTRAEILVYPPTLWPGIISFKGYKDVILGLPPYASFISYVANSLKIAISASLISSSVAGLAAYGFSRFNIKGKGFLLLTILAAQMFPGPSIMIPTFDIIKKMGLYNSQLALILLYSTFVQPFTVWMLYGYFEKVPKDLEEAAMIDGCNRIQSLVKVVLPIARPGLAAVGVYTFLHGWNEFTYALLLLGTKENYTISLGIARFFGEFATYWDMVGAAATVASVPVIILFLIFGKNLIHGLTAGAVKQ